MVGRGKVPHRFHHVGYMSRGSHGNRLVKVFRGVKYIHAHCYFKEGPTGGAPGSQGSVARFFAKRVISMKNWKIAGFSARK